MNIRRLRYFTIALAVTLTIMLAACGTNVNGMGGIGANSTSTSTTVKGYGTAVGCPSDVVVNPEPAAPNVIITRKQAYKTIIVQTGQVVEIDLPFGMAWDGPSTSQGPLQLQTPSGYALKDKYVCVWRFVAHSAGIAKLSFSGRALCKPNVACPLFIFELDFTVNVQ